MIVLLVVGLHAAAAVVWVGGMFYTLMVLRPAVEPMPGPQRLQLWRRVYPLFFGWVWAAIVILLVTGYWLLFGYFGGFANVGIYIHLMNGIGLAMMGLFAWVNLVPWPRFRDAVDRGAFDEAPRHMATIRRVVIVNLTLGLITIMTGAAGPWLTAYE